MSIFIAYIQTNWIEITGAILSLIYLYLSINQKVSLWFFGIISSLFYVAVFFETKLYADLSLQLYYVVISIYGWITWKKGDVVTHQELHATRMNKKQFFLVTVSTVAIYLIYYVVLTRFTDSSVPKSDALVGALSVIGTWMLARKFIENWWVWVAADSVCVALYVYKSLYSTAILFVVYTVMSVIGYFQWKKSMTNATCNATDN